MAWFKVDDTLAFHDKVVAAGNSAMGLWVRAGAWSSQMLTDGVVPTHMVAALGASDEAAALVDAGLWAKHPKGFAFHGWSDFQFTRDEVEAKRKYERDRKREQRRNALGQYEGVTPVVPVGQDRDTVGSPTNPSRPVPTQSPTDSKGARFDEFWALYPKKVSKGQAVKAWRAACKKADADTILASLREQLPSIAMQRRTDGDFRPNPATWLNGERWADAAEAVEPERDPYAGYLTVEQLKAQRGF